MVLLEQVDANVETVLIVFSLKRAIDLDELHVLIFIREARAPASFASCAAISPNSNQVVIMQGRTRAAMILPFALIAGSALAQEGYGTVTFTVKESGIHNVPTAEKGGFRNTQKSRVFRGRARLKYAGRGFAAPPMKLRFASIVLIHNGLIATVGTQILFTSRIIGDQYGLAMTQRLGSFSLMELFRWMTLPGSTTCGSLELT